MEKGNFEKEPKIEKQDLENFHQEIRELENKEIREKAEKADPYFTNMEINKLTEEDMNIWHNYKKMTIKNITDEDIQKFEKYREKIAKNDLSRQLFAGFLANKLTSLYDRK